MVHAARAGGGDRRHQHRQQRPLHGAGADVRACCIVSGRQLAARTCAAWRSSSSRRARSSPTGRSRSAFTVRNRAGCCRAGSCCSRSRAASQPLLIPYLPRRGGRGAASSRCWCARARPHRFAYVHVSSLFPFGFFRKGVRYRWTSRCWSSPSSSPRRPAPPRRRRAGRRPQPRAPAGATTSTRCATSAAATTRAASTGSRRARTGELVFMEREAERSRRLSILFDNAVGELLETRPSEPLRAAGERGGDGRRRPPGPRLRGRAGDARRALPFAGGRPPAPGRPRDAGAGRGRRAPGGAARSLATRGPAAAGAPGAGRRGGGRDDASAARSACCSACWRCWRPSRCRSTSAVRWPVLRRSILAGVAWFLRRACATRRAGCRLGHERARPGLPAVLPRRPVALGRGRLVGPMLHLCLFALLVKLFALSRERDKWQAVLGIFFLFLAAMGTSVHPAIVLYLVAFLVLWRWCCWLRFAFLHVLAGFGREDRALAGAAAARLLLGGAARRWLLSRCRSSPCCRGLRAPVLSSGGGSAGVTVQAAGFSDEVTLDSIGRIRGQPRGGAARRVRAGRPPRPRCASRPRPTRSTTGGSWRRTRGQRGAAARARACASAWARAARPRARSGSSRCAARACRAR